MEAEPVKAATAPSSLVYQPPTYVERLDLSTMFGVAQPLEVELGSGDGSFLAQWAQRHPERNFLGVERLLGRLRKLDRKGRRAGLVNLRLMRIEASYCVEYLLPFAAVHALHLYFPDPWPKRKHKKHRLVNACFAAAVAKVLASDGMVCLRTDDADYFSQMQEVFGANPSFVPAETPAELGAMVTDFEKDFQAQGKATLRTAYRRD